MNGTNMLAEFTETAEPLHVEAGPLLRSIGQYRATELETYLEDGGYRLPWALVRGERSAEDLLAELDSSGLRGRAGGGFPTGHKWALVASNQGGARVVVCNAHSAEFARKQSFLIKSAPHRVIEAVVLAALVVDAAEAFIFLGHQAKEEAEILVRALEESRAGSLVGPQAFGRSSGLEVQVVVSPGGYITGEETAMLNVLEGLAGQPRGKPPLPTEKGYQGRPTLVNNLETFMHAQFVLEHGAADFRASGTKYSPGTLLVTILGDIARPGIYEVPLGSPVRQLLQAQGLGGRDGRNILAVLPGIDSPILAEKDLDVALDFDSMNDVGSALGSGMLIALSDQRSIIDLAVELARFFHEASCGKCQPCKDGTMRIWNMLERLEDLDQPAVDLADRSRPPSLRGKGGLKIVTDNERTPISYTDTVKGLDKIRHLAEFFKYRGDCRHSFAAANALQRLLERYPDDFEAATGATNREAEVALSPASASTAE